MVQSDYKNSIRKSAEDYCLRARSTEFSKDNAASFTMDAWQNHSNVETELTETNTQVLNDT